MFDCQITMSDLIQLSGVQPLVSQKWVGWWGGKEIFTMPGKGAFIRRNDVGISTEGPDRPLGHKEPLLLRLASPRAVKNKSIPASPAAAAGVAENMR